MKLILHDAQIYDVVMGRALRTVPNSDEPASVTNCRRIYDESNFQAYSLIVRTTFTTANSGFVDAGVSLENGGHLMWTKLVRFNYGTSDDGLPYLKAAFYDQLRFIRKRMCHLITGRQKSARPVPFLLRMAIRSQRPINLLPFATVLIAQTCKWP
jgi:hypothetical protein